MNIYVSNLDFTVEREALKNFFTPYGVVASVNIIVDKLTNRSRGFAFVQMPDTKSAEKAIRELDGTSIGGRSMKVNEARRNDDRPNRSSAY